MEAKIDELVGKINKCREVKDDNQVNRHESELKKLREKLRESVASREADTKLWREEPRLKEETELPPTLWFIGSPHLAELHLGSPLQSLSHPRSPDAVREESLESTARRDSPSLEQNPEASELQEKIRDQEEFVSHVENTYGTFTTETTYQKEKLEKLRKELKKLEAPWEPSELQKKIREQEKFVLHVENTYGTFATDTMYEHRKLEEMRDDLKKLEASGEIPREYGRQRDFWHQRQELI
jgi:hypothetical protein